MRQNAGLSRRGVIGLFWGHVKISGTDTVNAAGTLPVQCAQNASNATTLTGPRR
jgi:hypothetical protein